MRIRRSFAIRVLLLAFALAVTSLSPSGASGESPWELLVDLRQELESGGPVSGQFVQTYIPAGFKNGDRESGHLSLWLPRCLRWNYEEPQEKSFLLCETDVWFWNPGEATGRRYQVTPEDEPGLDLLLVDVERLKERYVASSTRLGDGTYEIHLTLPPPAEGQWSARIRLDPVARRVAGLEYTDGEGNLTRFELSDYVKLSHTALFQPPQDLEWTEE